MVYNVYLFLSLGHGAAAWALRVPLTMRNWHGVPMSAGFKDIRM